MEVFVVTTPDGGPESVWFKRGDAETERSKVQLSLEFGGSKQQAYIKTLIIK